MTNKETTMPETTTIDLHGHTALPFPNFSEDATYLERVTIPDHDEAVKVLQDYGCDWGREPNLQRIWMRRGGPETDEQRDSLAHSLGPADVAWWECDEDHPGAVPFWKDSE